MLAESFQKQTSTGILRGSMQGADLWFHLTGSTSEIRKIKIINVVAFLIYSSDVRSAECSGQITNEILHQTTP